MHTVCFSPLAMLNAWASGQKPWSFDGVTDAVRDVIRLRLRLLPYLYSEFSRYHRHGIPPVRSTLLEIPADQPIVEDNSLLMFGSAILAAPFYEQFATRRTIRLPQGDWYDFYTGEYVGNAIEIERTAQEMKNRMPLFVKDGAVIPMLASAVHNTNAAYGQPLVIRHYGKSDGSFEIYEDDGKSLDYEQGAYRLRLIKVNANGELSETITHDNGPAMFGEIQSLVRMTK